jgi:hypothetical protein
LNIYHANPNSRTYMFYVIKCKFFYILYDIYILNSIQFAPVMCCFTFSFRFIFIQMDWIASNVLTIPIEKSMIFYYFIILINLPLYYAFQALPSLWDFFQLSSTCPFYLKIGTCSLNIMLNNKFNFHSPWVIQNPYNPRLNQK